MTERGEIRRDGAKAIKNSGRGQFQKGDAIWKDFVVDIKEYSEGYRVTIANWAKICTDALRTDRSKSPALKLVLGSPSQHKRVRLAVIEWEVLESLYERLEDAESRLESLDK